MNHTSHNARVDFVAPFFQWGTGMLYHECQHLEAPSKVPVSAKIRVPFRKKNSPPSHSVSPKTNRHLHVF